MGSSVFDYKLLKTSADLNADADYAGTQAEPAALVVLQVPQTSGQIVGAPIQLELVLEWLDDDVVVVGAGAFTLSVIKVVDRPADPGGAIVTDSVGIAGQGSRPILIGDVRIGDNVGVRITGITGPGSTEDRYRVFYRELWA